MDNAFVGVVVPSVLLEKMLVKGYLRTKDASLSDRLTEARNRRYLETVSDQVAGMLERNEPFSLALLDIDHFKRVNDTFGHDAGDKVLRIVAEVVRKRLRKSDTFVRYGGEEFRSAGSRKRGRRRDSGGHQKRHPAIIDRRK